MVRAAGPGAAVITELSQYQWFLVINFFYIVRPPTIRRTLRGSGTRSGPSLRPKLGRRTGIARPSVRYRRYAFRFVIRSGAPAPTVPEGSRGPRTATVLTWVLITDGCGGPCDTPGLCRRSEARTHPFNGTAHHPTLVRGRSHARLLNCVLRRRGQPRNTPTSRHVRHSRQSRALARHAAQRPTGAREHHECTCVQSSLRTRRRRRNTLRIFDPNLCGGAAAAAGLCRCG